MKTVAIIINIFFPGFGTFFVGKPIAAILQILLSVVGVVFTLSGVGAIIGIPMCLVAWIWALVTAISAPSQPTEVVVLNQAEVRTRGVDEHANNTGSGPSSQSSSPAPAMRKCPACAEDVRLEAKICRYCQRDLPIDEGIAARAAEQEACQERQRMVEETEKRKPKGTCPNCKVTLAIDSLGCPSCKADFSGQGWKVLPLSARR